MKRVLLPVAMVCLLCVFTNVAAAQFDDNTSEKASAVEPVDIGTTKNVHECKGLLLAGQFPAEDIATIKDRGIKRIISLRTEGELDWDEESSVKSADLEFVVVPFREPEELTDEVFDRLRELLADDEAPATMLHCGSANRVGAVWLPFRVLEQDVPLEQALEEAKKIGLRNEEYEARALDYIKREQGGDKQSVKPGINKRFLDPDLNVDQFVEIFEVESREVFAARQNIIDACGIKEGWTVGDIGAGTGLFTKIFSDLVGNQGHVFAVDISPKFIDHIDQQVKEHDLENISAVLCREDSVALPPASLHMAFICDTYHHFEFPAPTMNSIYRAVKPGGTLVVIDFHRIPGKSREWLLDHVRAGQDVFRSEIERSGFQFVEEVNVEGLEENYFMIFRK